MFTLNVWSYLLWSPVIVRTRVDCCGFLRGRRRTVCPTSRAGHDLDHLQIDHLAVPPLPLSEVMQDLHSRTDQTQGKSCATAVDRADYTARTRQHELDHTYHTIYLSALKGLDHDL